MLKTEEIITLEERWQEYKNRILFRRLVAIFLILLFTASLILLFLVLRDSSINNTNSNQAIHNETNQTTIASSAYINTTTVTANEQTNTVAEAINNQTLETETLKPIEMPTPNVSVKNNNTTNNSPKKVNNTINEQLPKIQEIIRPPVENKIIIETNNIQNIEELIKKFEVSNNIVFATMISEEYFERKNYKKSLEWALRANEIDSQNELSWIMFAKSQVKLGKINDAVRALEIYTNYAKDATSAANLLKNIRSGEYK